MRKILLILYCGLLFSCSKSPRFEYLSSEKTGIDFNNFITETDSFQIISYEYIYNGAGVGIGDLNNDGLQDLVFAGNQVSSKVYLNKGDFKFSDITADLEGLTNNQWFSSATLADVDGDGWTDIYLTSTADKNPVKCKNRLWINNGIKNGNGPTFTEVAEKFGVAEDGQSVNASFFDYDLDGDLDLYVLNNTMTHELSATYRPKISDGSAANNDKLYRNNGDRTFTDVTLEAGIVIEGFGLGLAISDLNKDGYPDIYISNDYLSNDLLYINQGNGTFRNEISKFLSYQTKSSMGNDIADINNDGNPDIFTLDMLPKEYYKKRQTINGFSYFYFIKDEKYSYEHQFLRNMLHIHSGFLNGEMLPYCEIGQMAGIYQTEWSWSPLFADYDNDGDKDLLVANGYPKDMTDKDWSHMNNKLSYMAERKFLIERIPALKILNLAFENTGDLKFLNRTKEWLPDIPSYSYGAAFVDLDNDGDLDYITNNLNDEAFILRNTTIEKSEENRGFIKIKLKGEERNSMAIGAKIELWSNGRYQFTENFHTRGYASSVDPVIHFGLSDASIVDSLKITWPVSGNVSFLKSVDVNRTLEIDEKTSKAQPDSLRTSPDSGLLFKESDNYVTYRHIQDDFNDYYLGQKILPHKFSQIGPVIAKGDLNNDGLEDLIIGSTNKLPTTVLLRTGKNFSGVEIDGLTTKKSYSESDIAVVDIDNDGDNDIVACAGGFENKSDSNYHHYLYVNRDNKFERTQLPVPSFPASVIRTCDFDHDGDFDLFVGARVKKDLFPNSCYSWLILNDRGILSGNSSGLDLGMVTDAIWSDYDKDGWEDLIITREWNSIKIFKNMNGKELVPQVVPGMEDFHGLWYSITAGDFDQDGDDDYMAGNIGNNHMFPVSEKYPLNLYSTDLDMDGNLDPVITGYWKDRNGRMKEYPVNYLDELIEQSVYFEKLFSDYTTFSYTGIDQIFDKSMLERVDFKLKVNTTSSFVIWNDGMAFRWEKLPEALQVSPVKKMIVQDLNGDKWPDLLVAGNDHTYSVSTGIFDANKGLVLLNDCKNLSVSKTPFRVLTPSESGLSLQGMVESLLWLKGDPSLVVAGVNRSKIEVFEFRIQPK